MLKTKTFKYKIGKQYRVSRDSHKNNVREHGKQTKFSLENRDDFFKRIDVSKALKHTQRDSGQQRKPCRWDKVGAIFVAETRDHVDREENGQGQHQHPLDARPNAPEQPRSHRHQHQE